MEMHINCKKKYRTNFVNFCFRVIQEIYPPINSRRAGTPYEQGRVIFVYK